MLVVSKEHSEGLQRWSKDTVPLNQTNTNANITQAMELHNNIIAQQLCGQMKQDFEVP